MDYEAFLHDIATTLLGQTRCTCWLRTGCDNPRHYHVLLPEDDLPFLIYSISSVREGSPVKETTYEFYPGSQGATETSQLIGAILLAPRPEDQDMSISITRKGGLVRINISVIQTIEGCDYYSETHSSVYGVGEAETEHDALILALRNLLYGDT